MARRMTTFLLLAGLVLVLAAAPAFAAKGGNDKTTDDQATIALDQNATLAATAAAVAWPSLGSEVTFSVTHAKNVRSPRVAVRCYQGGTMVYAQAGPYDQAFALGGAASDWLDNGGGADCTAELFYFVSRGNQPTVVMSLAWTSFTAAG